MNKNVIKKIVFCFKSVVIFLCCITFLFTSCGKDKTIEKIIYGEPITNGDNGNNNSNILNKEQFNSVAISREFNSFDDFYNYMKQCCVNKTDLREIKFKIKGSFTPRAVIYEENNAYKRIDITINSSPYMSLIIKCFDFNATYAEEIIFIINHLRYYSEYNFEVHGYAY